MDRPSVRARLRSAGRRALALVTATLALGAAALVAPQVAYAEDVSATAAADGCSYGTGGPNADALCWIDFSAFGQVTADELVAGGVSRDMEISLGRYRVNLTASVTAGADGANGMSTTALPTWGGSVLGNTIDGAQYFVQPAGSTAAPAFYQDSAVPSNAVSNAERDTITLTDIVVTDTVSGTVVHSGYALVVADAESTGTGEGFTWRSDSVLNTYQNVVPDGWSQPCTRTFATPGTTEITCSSDPNTSVGGRGIAMVYAESPTWIESSFRNEAWSDSRQGVAFALVFSTVNAKVEVQQGGGSNGEFTVTSSTGGDVIDDATSDGAETESGIQQFLSSPDGMTVDYSVAHTGGTDPAAYDITWTCTVNGEDVEPTLSNDGLTATITVLPNSSGVCRATAVAKPPVTEDAGTTINPNQTATLHPVTSPGNGEITSATFADGTMSKVVPGEGTWTIALVDGKAVATFEPLPDYFGTVTPQPYTVTDEYGLTASAQLTIDINDPPVTGPNTVTVDQGATATLTPTTTPGTGPIETATFDNGQTTKTVAGEGTWSISIVDGQPVATFTPESGFTGPVTSQPYTVTDTNGLTASSTLNVIIRPTTGDDAKVINPNETATLTPTTVPGSGTIETVVFDNGETTKTVAGEGTWSISLVDGQPVATFTPEQDYFGPVTTQPYTVTDENGESATGQLSIEINDPPVAEPATTVVDQGATATLHPATTPGTGALTGVTFADGTTTKVVPGEGTWTIALVDGEVVATFVPDSGFTGPVTQQSYTITDENGLTAESTLDVTIRPDANPDSVIVDQGATATLHPVVTPGSGPIESVVFDNGEATKVVPGEGTWTIELVDGQPVATFVPEDGFTGPVTQQSYTVTDANGETATSTLDVLIRPVTGDDAKVINPNETATLTPVTTPGSGPIESVVFDNGEASKVVPGEGTWTIELVDGQPVATFTPEQDYFGSVTPQSYTVTDVNGESATGQLSVEINDPPQAKPASETIRPNQTATLHPETIPGTGPLVSVTFDNGETTKVVPGEGTWTIELVDGEVVATFTPEHDYTGPVTPQTYIVTDENGLQASSTLSITIVVDPVPATGLPSTGVETSPLLWLGGLGAMLAGAFFMMRRRLMGR